MKIIDTRFNRTYFRNVPDVEFTTDINEVEDSSGLALSASYLDYQEFLDNSNVVGGTIEFANIEDYTFEGLREDVLNFVYNAIEIREAGGDSVRTQLQNEIDVLTP